MNVGKSFKSWQISGFMRSGEVQILMYSSSISWVLYVGAGRGLNISSNSWRGVLGLEESSMVSVREVDRGIVLERGEDE
jgi:hypothetical protein